MIKIKGLKLINNFWRRVVILSLMVLGAACSFNLAGDVTPPPGYQPPPIIDAQATSPHGQMFPLVPPDPKNGEAIYAEKCAPCHGALGLGDGPQAAQLPTDVLPLGRAQVARQAVPLEWYLIITEGNLERFMPPFQSLSDRQRWDVTAYILTLSMEAEALSQGAELYAKNCAGCHGERGSGDGPAASGLSVSPTNLTDQRNMVALSGEMIFEAISQGVPPAMPGFAELLTEEQRWALADYVRTLGFATSGVEQAEALPLTATPASDEQGLVEATELSPTPLATTAALTSTLPMGEVSGLVSHAEGETLPSGLEVTLRGFDHTTPVITSTVAINADGTYTFRQVEMPAGRIFLATVDFEGVTYGSEIVSVTEGELSLDLPIEVFSSTSDTSHVLVDRLHFFFEFLDEQTLRVVELYVISNPGTRTIVAPSGEQAVLRFSLPAGAHNLDFDGGEIGERFIVFDGGFGDTQPVRPGDGAHQVLLSYEMPYQRKLDLVRRMDFPVQAVVILIPLDSIKIKGQGIVDAGTRAIQGVEFHMYNAGGVQAGEEFRLTISGKPAGSGFSLVAGSSSSLVVGLAALGVTMIAAGLWLYRRHAPAPEKSDASLAEEEALPPDADSIMDAILALDDLYLEGSLPADAYHQRREELKAHLRQVLRSSSK